MRCATTLIYNGTSFLGSQIQKDTNNTIFGQFEKVLQQLGIKFRVIASGRTDKGVHSTGQVCHFDLPHFWSDLIKLKRVLNGMLPQTIRVKDIKHVADDFHARYGAKRRVYRYVVKQSDSNPFEEDFITFDKNIEFKIIDEKIKLFIGEHNFQNFMKKGSDINSTVRIIYKAFAYKHNGLIVLNFEANGFLRSQIRLMVGAILKLDTQKIEEKLSCEKNHKVRPAPSNGLYLAKIKY